MIEIIITLLIAHYSPTQNNIQILEPIQFSQQLYLERPSIEANSYLVFNKRKNEIMSHKNYDNPQAIASLTKLMTAFIIINEHDLNETVTVTASALQVEPVAMGLRINEQITIKSLLYGLLIESANDAAYTLAIHNSGSVSEFVKKMNNYAEKMHLNNTSFQNPAGFDHPNNYSTPFDLLILTTKLLEQPIVKEIVEQDSFTISNTTNTITHELRSTNKLLNTEFSVIGLKTGTTPKAGECFISYTNSDNPIITIILNSPNRFQETKNLIEWADNVNNQ